VLTVHGTKKFLGRVPNPVVAMAAREASTTALGAWYATVLFWRPQVALFVNEPTRLPVFVALAPGVSVIERMTLAAELVFTALGLPDEFVRDEIAEMRRSQVMKTASRSVLGSMNDFSWLAEAHRPSSPSASDLIELSLSLAQTPCGPLYSSHVSPDREIVAYVAQQSAGDGPQERLAT
jgi:hypothetical protein